MELPLKGTCACRPDVAKGAEDVIAVTGGTAAG